MSIWCGPPLTEGPNRRFIESMENWFPRSYSDAVQMFQTSIKPWSSQAETGRWDIPSRSETDLFTDHMYLPAKKDPRTLLVLMSGVHGPETYAGHAIQRRFLIDLLPRINRDRLGVFVVHALNPYGFKFNKRHTENGVNLNRNCSASDQLYSVQNPRSLELSERFIPRVPLASEMSELFKSKKEQDGRVTFGEISLDEFIKAVAPGQFSSREGFEFGGLKAEPQIVALRWRLRELMPRYRDIVFFDLHTGLGHRGRLHLLTGDSPRGIHKGLFNEILDPDQDREFYEFTPSHAEGFYSTHGSTNDLFAELAAPEQRLCALTMEFGTLGHDLPAQLTGLNLWMAEHQGNLYGYRTPELRAKIEAAHLEKSNPSSSDWQKIVLTAAHGLLSRVLVRLNALA